MGVDFTNPIDRKNTASLKWEKYRGSDILPMWVADMDFPIAGEIVQALQQQLEHPLLGYTVASAETAELVCEYLLKDFAWKVDPDCLVWLPGVVPGLWAGCKAFGKPGEEALFNTPIYHHFFHSPEQADMQTKPVSLQETETGRWTYDFAALENAVGEKSSIMMLCSPHNPTGTLFTVEETQAMGRFCKDHDLIILSDEIHCGLVLAENKQHVPTAVACPDYADNIITLMSPSKTFNLAGLNCSFAVISDPQLRKQFKAVCSGVLPEVPGMAYTALRAAYGEAGAWQQALLQQLRDNYAYLKDAIDSIPGLSMSPMEATYLAWINTEKLLIDDAAALFEEYGVGLSPGKGFGSGDYVRLNFACPRSTLEEGVSRMRKAVASLG